MGGTDDREFAAFVRDAGPGLATAAWVLTGHAPTAESLAGEALGRLHPRWAQVRHRPVTAAEQELVDVYAGHRAGVGAPPPAPEGDDGGEQDEDERDHGTGQPRSVADALSQLPAAEREVAVLRHYLRCPEERVAEVVGADTAAVRATEESALRRLAVLLRGPADLPPPAREDVLAELGRAGADAPPLRVEPGAVLAGARRHRRRRRFRVALLLAGAVAALAAYAGISGALSPEESEVDTAVPTWDVTREFTAVVELRPRPGREDVALLAIERGRGESDFRVELEDGGRRTRLTRVEGDFPGETRVYRGLEHTVALTPVPPGLRPDRVTIVGDVWLAGPPRTHVAEDEGQALLIHLLPRVGVTEEAVQEILWLAGDTVVAAGSGPVDQVDLGVTGGVRAFALPELGLTGIARTELGSPFFVGEARVGMRVRFGVGVAAGEPAAGELPTLLFTLLPPEAEGQEVHARDTSGRPVPMRTAPLGDHVAAWVVHDDDFGRDADDQLAVAWTGADGVEHAVRDPTAALVLDLHGEEYRVDHRDGLLQVMGGGVLDEVPLRPDAGVVPLDAFRRDLALVTGVAAEGELVLVPSDQPGPLAVVEQWPHASGRLGRDGPVLTLVDLTRPGRGAGAEPVAALGLVTDDVRCRFTRPPGLTTHETVFEGAGRTGTLTYLPELDVVLACLGDLAIGGPVEGHAGRTFLVAGEEFRLGLRFGPRDEEETPDEPGEVLLGLPVDDATTVHVLLRDP